MQMNFFANLLEERGEVEQFWSINPDIERYERALSTLISRCLVKPAVVRRHVPEHRFSDNVPWVIFSCGAGGQFGIALGSCVDGENETGVYATILGLAKAVSTTDRGPLIGGVRPRIVERFSEATPMRMYQYDLLDRKSHRRIPRDVWYAETKPGLIATVVGDGDSSYAAAREALVESWNVYVFPDVRLHTTRILSGYMLAQSLTLNFPRIIHFNASVSSGMILLNIKEVSEMERNSVSEIEETLLVSVCIGSIDLSVQDLDRLRPGMTLEFECPESIEGVLKIGAFDWMNVKLVADVERNRFVIVTENFI